MKAPGVNPFVDVYQHMTAREKITVQLASTIYGGCLGIAIFYAITYPAVATSSNGGFSSMDVLVAVGGAVAMVVVISIFWRWQKGFYASCTWAQSQGYSERDFHVTDALPAALWSVGIGRKGHRP